MAGLLPELGGLVDELTESLLKQSYVLRGAGSRDKTFQELLTQIDKFGINVTFPNYITNGITFITRPMMNMTLGNLRQQNTMSLLASDGPDSVPFSIRCMLDARISKFDDRIDPIVKQNADSSRVVNNNFPFIPYMTNSLEAIDGWPDITIETYTTEGGYMGEDQTMPIGMDFGDKTYDLTLHFREVDGGMIMATFQYWLLWMGLATRGTMVPYPESEADNIAEFTCSIYRFTLDNSRRFIKEWSRATGCFPKSIPKGAIFNQAEGENFISAAMKFSVPFVANHIRHNDPLDFLDFNTLMQMYAGENYTENKVQLPAAAEFNFMGLPYVDVYNGVNELVWLANPSDLTSVLSTRIDELTQSIDSLIRNQNQATTTAGGIEV